MAYNPLTGRYTPDEPVAYNPLSGMVATPPEQTFSGTPFGQVNPPSNNASSGVVALTPQQIADQQSAKLAADTALQNRQSAYDILLNEFTKYGLSSLVEPLKGLIQSNLPPSQFSLELQNTKAYQQRFSANADRIAKGLTALSPAAYIGLEDQYQKIMRNYGLPASYYAKDSMGTQSGFNQLLANDVSSAELEDRVMTAQNRVINAAPEVTTALKQFYPDITNSDILAYTLDPTKALSEIKRKVTAAEIGGAAIGAGLGTSVNRAEELARYGATTESAKTNYNAIGGGLQRGSQLASIYGQDPYTQTTAEQELFNLPGQVQAKEKRKKIIGMEKATFSGQTGITSGALARDRAGSY